MKQSYNEWQIFMSIISPFSSKILLCSVACLFSAILPVIIHTPINFKHVKAHSCLGILFHIIKVHMILKKFNTTHFMKWFDCPLFLLIKSKNLFFFFDEFYAQLTKSTNVANAIRPAILDTANIRADVLDWTNMLILWKQRFLDKQLITKKWKDFKTL